MNLVEANQQPIPDRLYHGTSSDAWEQIQTDGMMRDDPDRPSGGVSFSTTGRVAEEFVRLACQRDGCEEGVVLVFDGAKVAADFPLAAFSDDGAHADASWRITNEREWRIAGNTPFGPVSRYLVNKYTAWKDSYDDPVEWGPGADKWRNVDGSSDEDDDDCSDMVGSW